MLMRQWNLGYVLVFYLWTGFTMAAFTASALKVLKTIWKRVIKKSQPLLDRPILYSCLALLLFAMINPLSILMLRESIGDITFDDRIFARLFDLWSLLLSLLFIGFIGEFFLITWRAITKKLSNAFLMIVVLLCLTLITAFINPVGNLLIFNSVTQAAQEDMWKSLKSNDIVGKSPEMILELYGKPRRIGKGRRDETWAYYPGPWYAAKWTTILINFQNDKVVEYYWDD